MLCFAGFKLDQHRAELRGPDGTPIKLRSKSFDLLLLLANNAGRIVDKQELMNAVWPNVHVAEDSLFQCIRELRVALGDDQRQLIRVVSGRGYVLEAEVTRPTAPPAGTGSWTVLFGLRTRWVGALALSVIVGLAAAASFRLAPPPPVTLAVMPIIDASADPDGAAMAAAVTDQLIDGLAAIDTIEVISPRADASDAAPTFVIKSELSKEQDAWTLKARLIEDATGAVAGFASITVNRGQMDTQLQQTRLAAGVGDRLARKLNALLEVVRPADARGNSNATSSKVAIEQASASINETTPERFAVAQRMLQDALAVEPDNIDVQLALAGLQLRGIQMVWYNPAEQAAAEGSARALLKQALAEQPRSIAALEAQCRFLSVTNAFAESLIACGQVLSFNPWDGSSLFLIGLGQMNLGRFADALATFQLADRYDTPPVSRWTWLLGAGWANLMLGQNAEAVSWLERSIAITPASGRSHMLLAAAYKGLGRADAAKAAMARGMALRPASTASNVMPPLRNSSPIFVAASQKVMQTLIELGLPER